MGYPGRLTHPARTGMMGLTPGRRVPRGAGGRTMDEVTFSDYVRAWRERQREGERRRRERFRQAEKAAARLAEILVREYGAREVWLFGSLARVRGFHGHSDIDLAASGLPAREFFRILSRLNALTEFEVDLVDLEACPAWLAEAIRREGRLLAGPADGPHQAGEGESVAR